MHGLYYDPHMVRKDVIDPTDMISHAARQMKIPNSGPTKTSINYSSQFRGEIISGEKVSGERRFHRDVIFVINLYQRYKGHVRFGIAAVAAATRKLTLMENKITMVEHK